MQLCRKIKREVEQAGECNCSILAAVERTREVEKRTASVSRGKTSESIMKDSGVWLCADFHSIQSKLSRLLLAQVGLAASPVDKLALAFIVT